MPELLRPLTILVVLGSILASVCMAQTDPPPREAKTVSEVDAGLGPCTADFIVTNDASKPVYAASVRVHITYGFMSLHKFDLEVGTNSEGKARFIGLPQNSKQGFFFRASEGNREGSAFDDPSKTCKAQFTIVLRPKPPE
jgi:hypothetical protein